MDKFKRQELADISTAMTLKWIAKDFKECYRLFFVLSLDDRHYIESIFEGARTSWPDTRLKKVASDIYKMIRRNHDREAKFMIDHLVRLLKLWFCTGGPDAFYTEYVRLDSLEKDWVLSGLREVISDSDDPRFRQAAIDIPKFLQEKLETKIV